MCDVDVPAITLTLCVCVCAIDVCLLILVQSVLPLQRIRRVVGGLFSDIASSLLTVTAQF